jgi:hypothetical protein
MIPCQLSKKTKIFTAYASIHRGVQPTPSHPRVLGGGPSSTSISTCVHSILARHCARACAAALITKTANGVARTLTTELRMRFITVCLIRLPRLPDALSPLNNSWFVAYITRQAVQSMGATPLLLVANQLNAKL